jgi:hypothetical protein
MTVTKKGPRCPLTSILMHWREAIAAARKIREANPGRYKTIPVHRNFSE